MNSLRTLINLFEEEIDPTKVVTNNDPIDPSKVVIDNPNSNNTAPKKKTGPKNPNVKALQDEIVKASGDNKIFPKYGADGIWGNETAGVVFSDPKYIEIAKKYADTIPQVKSIMDAKGVAQDIGKRTQDSSDQLNKQFPNSSAQAATTGQSNSSAQAANATPEPVVDQDAGAKETAKKFVDNTTAPAYIDSKDGMIKYMDSSSNQPKIMPSDWIPQYAPELDKALKDLKAGTPQTTKFLWWNVNNGTKVDIRALDALSPNASNGTGLKMPNTNTMSLGQQTPSAADNSNATQPNPYSLVPPKPQLNPLTKDVQESVGFDELQRLVSLVHHR